MSASFTTREGQAVRLIGNNLLVRPDPPRKETAGGLIIANPDVVQAHGTGEVVAIGYLTGPRAALHTPIPGLSVGDRVLYLRVLAKTDVNPQIKHVLDEDVIRIRPSDVLLVMDEEDRNRVQ